jgi:hypothetical protein
LRRRRRCQSRLRDKDDPTEVVSSLLGKVETKNLLRKSKPAFFALQELSVMVRAPVLLLRLSCARVEHVARPRPIASTTASSWWMLVWGTDRDLLSGIRAL